MLLWCSKRLTEEMDYCRLRLNGKFIAEQGATGAKESLEEATKHKKLRTTGLETCY